MDLKTIYNSAKGDKIEFITQCAMREWGLDYEDANDLALKAVRLDSFRRDWNDLAPPKDKNKREEERMRIKYSPAEQNRLKFEKMLEDHKKALQAKDPNLSIFSN